MADSMAAAPDRAAGHEVEAKVVEAKTGAANLAIAIPAQRKVNTVLSLPRTAPKDRFRRSGTCAHLDRRVSKVGASGCGLFWHKIGGNGCASAV